MPIKLSQKAKRLTPGGTIGILSSGAPLSPERFALSMKTLADAGWKAKCPLDPTLLYGKTDAGFASAPAADRVRALYELLQDREVDVVLAVRGAYGCLDILPRIDFEQIRAANKLLIGCSDFTVLLLQAAGRVGIPSIHGSTLGSSFADAPTDDSARQSVEQLLQMLTLPEYRIEEKVEVMRAGTGQGPLLAGNLTMLLTLLGTPWDVDYQGCVLVLEEVGEAPYRVHRALTQLKLAGKLDRLAGLVFGRFARCESKHGPTVEEVMDMAVKDLLPQAPYPIVRGLEVGHWGKNIPLPLGCLAAIKENTFSTLESPIVS